MSLVIEELRVALEDIQQRLVITQFPRQFPNVKIRILEGQRLSSGKDSTLTPMGAEQARLFRLYCGHSQKEN